MLCRGSLCTCSFNHLIGRFRTFNKQLCMLRGRYKSTLHGHSDNTQLEMIPIIRTSWFDYNARHCVCWNALLR